MTNQPLTTRRPFEEWDVEELAYLEETLTGAFKDIAPFLSDDAPNMGRWYAETIEQISGLLDRCGIPFREGSSIRELGVQGRRAIDLIETAAN